MISSDDENPANKPHKSKMLPIAEPIQKAKKSEIVNVAKKSKIIHHRALALDATNGLNNPESPTNQ